MATFLTILAIVYGVSLPYVAHLMYQGLVHPEQFPTLDINGDLVTRSETEVTS
jgi:hypothetical protein